MYEIRIKGVRNGLIVNVGCWELVFNSIPEFVAELSKYLTNPESVGKEWQEKYGGKPEVAYPQGQMAGIALNIPPAYGRIEVAEAPAWNHNPTRVR